MGDETVLHQIFDRLGNIEGQLQVGGRRHDEFSRNLADIDKKVDHMSDRLGLVESVAGRIEVIEPAVWRLEEGRLEKQGAKKFVGATLKRGHVIAGLIAGAAGWLAAHVPSIWPLK